MGKLTKILRFTMAFNFVSILKLKKKKKADLENCKSKCETDENLGSHAF